MTTVGEAASSMGQADRPAVLVSDSLGKVVGIVTQADVVRHVASRAPADQPVETIMTAQVMTVSIDDCLFKAIATMRRHRLGCAPVLDAGGKVVGLLSLHDVLLYLSGWSMHVIDLLLQDAGIAGLRRVKGYQVELARALLDEEAPNATVLAALSEINFELHRRALDGAISEMASHGWGEPPVSFALIVMGSSGRGEALLGTDQDNGFILSDYDDAEHTRIDAYFVPLAQRFTRALEAVGFPLCLGNVMATNPVWRKRISEWREQVDTWLRRRTETQLLLSDVLFDFQHVCGDAALSRALRRHVTHAFAADRTFVRDLFKLEAEHEAALGWFGRLRSERDKGDRPGMINLKLRGLFPLVEAARLLSVRAGVPATSTLARLDGLQAMGALHPEDHGHLKDAFQFVSRLLLRQQIEDLEAGRPVDDFVPEVRLSKREKQHLVSCFKAIGNVRSALHAELGASPL